MNKINLLKNKKGQEEMVGFALIIIVVSVILLFFLMFTLRDNERIAVESYEVQSFLQASMQYTTQCKNNFEFLDVQDLVYACAEEDLSVCIGGGNPCQLLGTTFEDITEASWPIGTTRPIKGYELYVKSNNQSLIDPIIEGNQTSSSKGAPLYLSGDIEITFTAYY